MPPPRCVVRAPRPGAGLVLVALAAFSLSCGEDDDATGSLDPGEPGSIEGRVLSEDGEPLAGARVGTSPATSIAFTDARGGFRIEGVEPGSYASLRSPRGSTRPSPRPRWTTEPRRASTWCCVRAATGLVLRANDARVPEGTTVVVLREASDCGDPGRTPFASAVTDPGGRFLTPPLPPGSYLACVRVEIGGAAFAGREGFVVRPGELAQVDLVVARDDGQSTDPSAPGARRPPPEERPGGSASGRRPSGRRR